MSDILKYIILLSSFFFIFANPLYSQEEKMKVDLWQGFKVEIDAFSAIMSIADDETYSFEGNIQFNLKEKYFPILEIGVAGVNKTSKSGFDFKTNGLFSRIGFDYNLLAPNEPDVSIRKYFFVGARYGFSNFSYDIKNVTITDDYWGGSTTIAPMTYKTYQHWLEVVAGIRVEIFKNIFLGWNVRRKILLGKEKDGEITPYFIPGIGVKSMGNWDINYTIGYKF